MVFEFFLCTVSVFLLECSYVLGFSKFFKVSLILLARWSYYSFFLNVWFCFVLSRISFFIWFYFFTFYFLAWKSSLTFFALNFWKLSLSSFSFFPSSIFWTLNFFISVARSLILLLWLLTNFSKFFCSLAFFRYYFNSFSRLSILLTNLFFSLVPTDSSLIFMRLDFSFSNSIIFWWYYSFI